MKKLLLLLSLNTVFNITNAQVVFCPPGAEWHYTFMGSFFIATYNEEIKYTGDVVIANQTVKKLEHTRFFTASNDMGAHITTLTYIKESGDTVFMKNPRTQNNWQILYNFAALPGQFWTNTLDDGNSTVHHLITVDSISHVTLNGILLKRMFVTYDNDVDAWGQGDTSQIIERIGNNKFLFNYEHHEDYDGDELWEFLCYKDDFFGLKKFSSKACDFSNTAGIEQLSFQNDYLRTYPNPTSSKLNLEFSTLQIISVRIENSLGQLVYTEKEFSTDKEIDLSFLSCGMYYLTLQNKSETKTLKLVKE